MAWIELGDDWRDESTEGPYIETLQCKYDWKAQIEWSVFRGLREKKFTVSCRPRSDTQDVEFDTLTEAKEYVNNKIKESQK